MSSPVSANTSTAVEAAIDIRRLHYGKLVDATTGAVPSQSGYEVTRRSFDLDPSLVGHLSPARLIGRRRFDPDAIETSALRSGCFVARTTAYDATALMRARFRPEDGENGGARRHQQSSVWVVAFDDWRRFPAACLAIAAGHLRADPDLAAETAAVRLAETPSRWRFQNLDVDRARAVLLRDAWGCDMLEFFLDAASSDAAACLDFDARDFANERDFLAAAGFALQSLSSSYPRWRDVSVACGLAYPAPGVCLRYSPDHALPGALSDAA